MRSNPPPVENGETPTTDTLLKRPWVCSSWKYLFRRRQELGVARYGTPLQPHNGRDAILDAAEEFQDATVYAEQCIREGRVPVAVGAVLQLLCLFALRVLWYYAGTVTQERIVGLERTDATEEVKAEMRRRLLGGGERVEVVLSPSALHRNPEKFGSPLLAGTYDPPDSQEPLGFMEDMPTMCLRAVIPQQDSRPFAVATEDIKAREYGWLQINLPPELVAPVGVDTDSEHTSLDGEDAGLLAPRGFWANVAGTWRWRGAGGNKGHSVSRMLDGLRSENAAE